ncbi:ABC transporter permease [Gracilimonas sp.]|uniref:ABC transporter permease n=1 Tax=Gracilimonas sp. TaxID=1974203 RepID=UPI0032ED6395
MLKNYFKIAIRNLTRNKVFGFISILGLAVGITGATLLYLYVDNELGYDAFYEKSDQIYRVVEIDDSQGQRTRYYGQTAPVLGSTLEENFPEIEKLVRVYQPIGHVDMEWKGEALSERNWLMADPAFFELFDFEVVQGDISTALSEPNSVVISEKKAQQLFGNQNPIGEVLTFSNLGDNTVTAVVKNVPDNSHLQFDLLFSRRNSNINWQEYLSSWDRYGAYTYLLLGEEANMVSFETKLDGFIESQQATNENARNFYLQPITDIYFNSQEIEFGIESAHGNIFYIYVFSAIGIFLLLIAGINYMNLATALSVQRGKEIGIRKAAGAEKRQLIGQFLSESVVIALLACIGSYFLIELLLPYFNQLTGKSFSITSDSFGYIALVLLGIGLFLGISSGSYPAFYLALIKPIRVLKTNTEIKGGNLTLRKVLVIAQFSLSIILIIGTLAAYKQIDYIRTADLGFEEEQMLVMDINSGNTRARFDAMKQEIAKLTDIQDVAVSSRVPGEWKNITQTFTRSGQSSTADSVQTYFMSFDEDMLQLYNINLVSGRNFTGNKLTDSLTVLLNQTAVKALNLDEPIGKTLRLTGVEEPVRVVGVVEDFNYQSLHQQVAPLLIGYWANPVQSIDYFSVKFSAKANIPAAIEELKKIHGQFDPASAMEYHFLDQQIEQMYQADVRAGRLFAIGGGVTIFIACLGLFGLALFSTQQRIKEIGIRKVLGATTPQILMLLTTDFMKLVAIAFLLAIPVGWIVMNNWLQNFAYHADLGIGIFVLGGLGVLIISLLTVSSQSIKASMSNPIKSLRSE